MDEPLSNLDAKLRVATRAEILKLHDRVAATTVYVTHDQVEAMTMGDRIVVMSNGVLQQVGTPEDLYTKPVNLFVAGFIGSPAMNLVPAPVIGAGDTGKIAGFRPEHLDLGNGHVDAIRFDGRIEVIEYLGDEQIVHVVVGDTDVVAKLPVEDRLARGAVQTFALERDKLHLFDALTQRAVPA
jgi:multiple sugar transport system ATP-binding protein